MGTWGSGVFDDDLACEVRETYLNLLATNGNEGAAATEAVLDVFREVLADDYSAAVFWIALAVVQWRAGRLEDRTKELALKVIESDSALRPFYDDHALLAARRKALDKVVALLNSAQPKPRRVRKRFKNSSDWEAGELIAFRLRSGRNVIFRVVGLWTDSGGTSPVVEVLDWCGYGIPETVVLQDLPIRSNRVDVPLGFETLMSPYRSQFLIGEISGRWIPHDRISRLGVKLPPTQEIGGFCGWPWRRIDEQLEREFGYQ